MPRPPRPLQPALRVLVALVMFLASLQATRASEQTCDALANPFPDVPTSDVNTVIVNSYFWGTEQRSINFTALGINPRAAVEGLDPLTVTLSVLLEKSLALCSGYVCACNWRPYRNDTLPARMTQKIAWQPYINLALREVAYRDVLAPIEVQVFNISQQADVAMPVPYTFAESLDAENFVPLFESPGTTFITLQKNLSKDVLEALFNDTVIRLLLGILCISVFFGVVLYTVEVNMAKDTLFPKTIIDGTAYSVWYTTCVTIGMFFGEAHPRSQVARVIILVFKYITVLALVSLNARVILAVEPTRDDPISSSLAGKMVAATIGTPEEMRCMARGAIVKSVPDTDQAFGLLMDHKVDAVAVDTLLANYLIRSPSQSFSALKTSGTISEAVMYGYYLSETFASKPAIDFDGKVNDTTTMRQCLKTTVGLGSAHIVATLQALLPNTTASGASSSDSLFASLGITLPSVFLSIVFGLFALASCLRHTHHSKILKRAGFPKLQKQVNLLEEKLLQEDPDARSRSSTSNLNSISATDGFLQQEGIDTGTDPL